MKQQKFVLTGIFLFSLAAVLLLLGMIYNNPWQHDQWPSFFVYLSDVNAGLNSLTVLFLLLGIKNIKQRQTQKHRKFMLCAAASSTLFLASYCLYHFAVGETAFLGAGWIRPVYFFILISHILLAIGVLPIVLITFYFALSSQFTKHKKIARFTFPIWLYVSITGVLVYLLLKIYS